MVGRRAGDNRSPAPKAGRFKKSVSLPLETVHGDKQQQSSLRSFSTARCSPLDPAVSQNSGQGDETRQGCRRRRDSKRVPRASRGESSPPATISPRKVIPCLANTPVASVHEKGFRGTPSVSSEDSPAPTFPKAPVNEGGNQQKGFRRDYMLGDAPRADAHMITEPTDVRAFEAVAALDNYDFAFLKRSDGSFSYAVLAFRSMEPITRGNRTSLVECMTFVTCNAGTTKKVSKKKWAKHVRRVSTAPHATSRAVSGPAAHEGGRRAARHEHDSLRGSFSKWLRRAERQPHERVHARALGGSDAASRGTSHTASEPAAQEGGAHPKNLAEEVSSLENPPPIRVVSCIQQTEDGSTISNVSKSKTPLRKWSSLGKGQLRTKANCHAHRTEKKGKEVAQCPRRSIRGFGRWNSYSK